MRWEENRISGEYLYNLKKIRNLTFFVFAVWFSFLSYILFLVHDWDFYWFMGGETFGLGVAITTYLNMLYTVLNYPKYIKWDEKGIYTINHRGKKQFTPWRDIKYIKKLKEVEPKSSYVEDFALEKKCVWFNTYILDPKIGKETYHEWLKHKEE
jgi:hypothetical protein